MPWVDTHCHLQLDGRDPGDLLGRAPDVAWVVVPGVDAVSSASSLALAERHQGQVVATAGLHPHDADKWSDQANAISTMATQVAAIGETGLDFYRSLSSPDDQERSFRAQIELAVALDKPLIVHCRDAFSKVHEIVEELDIGERTVLHCWTGGRKWTRRFLDLGVTFSYAGPLAFETGETIRLGAELVPPGRSLVETDTPYLAPPPHRRKQNEPAWVALVGEALAGVWGMDVEEVAVVTTANAERIFK